MSPALAVRFLSTVLPRKLLKKNFFLIAVLSIYAHHPLFLKKQSIVGPWPWNHLYLQKEQRGLVTAALLWSVGFQGNIEYGQLLSRPGRWQATFCSPSSDLQWFLSVYSRVSGHSWARHTNPRTLFQSLPASPLHQCPSGPAPKEPWGWLQSKTSRRKKWGSFSQRGEKMFWPGISQENSLVVLKIGLHVPTARGTGSIPGQGTKNLYAMWHGQKNNIKIKSHHVCACSIASVMSTLCDPMHWSPPGSLSRGILQATCLEWMAMPFSRDISSYQVKRKKKRSITELLKVYGMMYKPCEARVKFYSGFPEHSVSGPGLSLRIYSSKHNRQVPALKKLHSSGRTEWK